MGDVTAFGVDIQQAMQAPVKVLAEAELLEGDQSHAGHDAHVEHHVDGIGEFNAAFGKLGPDWPHEIRNHIHRAPFHAAVGQTIKPLVHPVRVLPIVGRPRLFPGRRADVSALLDPGDVVRVRSMIIASRPLLLI